MYGNFNRSEYNGLERIGKGLYYFPGTNIVYIQKGSLLRPITIETIQQLPDNERELVLQYMKSEKRTTIAKTKRIKKGKKEYFIDPQNPEKEFYIEEQGLDKYGNEIWKLVCDENGIPVKFLED